MFSFRFYSFLLKNQYSQLIKLNSLSTRINQYSNSSHKLNSDLYILNKNGSLEIHSGPFDRAEICEKYFVEPRDLQKIDPDLHINVPLIDVRQNKFICFSFRRHRSLIQSNRSIFFLPSTEKTHNEPLRIEDSTEWERISNIYLENIRFIHQSYNEKLFLPQFNSIPFEFLLTEINLDSIAQQLKNKTDRLIIEFENVRQRAYGRITIVTLRELLIIKERVDKHKRTADLTHKAIIDVLDHDEDLIGMYLTDQRQRDLSDHIQIELLLEASAKQLAEVSRPISDLSDSIETLEKSVGFMLDAVRNELIAFEIRINIITMSLGLGAFLAGIYGMNISNGLEQHPNAFYFLIGTSIFIMTGISSLAMIRLLRYRKIKLHKSNLFKIF